MQQDYSVSGACDSTLPTNVVVKLTDKDDDTNSVSNDNVTCTNDEYSVSLDGRAITSADVTVAVTHGSSQSAHFDVSNLIVRLALDALPAVFNLSTAPSYRVSGTCDFSLGENVTITLVGTSVDGSPVSGTSACVSGNTFSGDLAATAVTASTFTVQVVYGAGAGAETQTSASVTNSIVRLSLTQPTAPFNAVTDSSYPLAGACDHSIAPHSRVTISLMGVVGVEISKEVACDSGHSFSGTLDASAVTALPSPPSTLVFEASYGAQTSTASAISNDYRSFVLNALGSLNGSTAAAYAVSGSCDDSLNANVTLSAVGVAAIAAITGSVLCQSGVFSTTLDLHTLTQAAYPTVTIEAEYDGQTVSKSTSNAIVILAFTGTQGPITETNKASYTISGTCDPSLGNVSITVEGPTLSESVSCDSAASTFSANINVSSMASETASITIGQSGGATVTQSVSNDIISMDATLSALTLSHGTLTPSFGSETTSYTATVRDVDSLTVTATQNHRDSTLVSSPAGTKIDKITTIPLPVALAVDSTLTITVTAEDGVTSKEYILVVTKVELYLGTLSSLGTSNEGSYAVTGGCDSAVSNSVTVVMSGPDTAPKEVPCGATNTFSATIDASGIVTHPVVVKAIQGNTVVTKEVDNDDKGTLYFSSLPPLATDVAYALRGFCDTASGTVTIVIGEPNVTTNTPCKADGTFSSDVDVQGVSSHPAKVSFSQGGSPMEMLA